MCCGKIKKSEKTTKLNITPVVCEKCDWRGTVGDCEDILECPRCAAIVKIDEQKIDAGQTNSPQSQRI